MNENTLYIVLFVPYLKSGTVFADCHKWHISISFSEGMVGLLDLLFVRRSFLGVKPPKNIKKSDIKIFGLVPYYYYMNIISSDAGGIQFMTKSCDLVSVVLERSN